MTMQRLNVPRLNAKDLHALVAVAHFGSLINASAFLQTSQSALTGARVVDMTRTRRRKA